MPTDRLSKRRVNSGALEFRIGSDGLLRVRIPVGEPKADEAVPLLEELYTAALVNYYKTKNLNPREVANCLRAVADAIEQYQIKLTEDKYSGRKRTPHPSD